MVWSPLIEILQKSEFRKNDNFSQILDNKQHFS